MQSTTLLQVLPMLAILNASVTTVQTPDAASIVARATERLESLTSYKATIDTKSTVATLKHSKYLEIWMKMSNGKLYYRLERLLPTVQPSGPYVYLRNAAGTWEVWSNRAFNVEFEDATPYRQALPLPGTQGPAARLPDAELSDHTQCYLIRQTPRTQDPNIVASVSAKIHLKYVDYYIAKDSYLIRAINWVDEHGTVVRRSKATQLQYNVPIAESEFAVPPGLPRSSMQTRAEYLRMWIKVDDAAHTAKQGRWRLFYTILLGGVATLVLWAGMKIFQKSETISQ